MKGEWKKKSKRWKIYNIKKDRERERISYKIHFFFEKNFLVAQDKYEPILNCLLYLGGWRGSSAGSYLIKFCSKIYTSYKDLFVAQRAHLLIMCIDLFHRPCLCYQLQSIEQSMYVLLL